MGDGVECHMPECSAITLVGLVLSCELLAGTSRPVARVFPSDYCRMKLLDNLSCNFNKGQGKRRRLSLALLTYSMIRLFTFLAAILTIGCSNNPDSRTPGSQEVQTSPENKDPASTQQKLPVEVFWDKFQILLAEDDSTALADLFHFPIRRMPYSYDQDNNGMTRTEFLDNYSRLFFPKLREGIKSSTVSDFELTEYNLGELKLDNSFVHYISITTKIIDGDETSGQTTSFVFGELEGTFQVIEIPISN